MLCPFRPSFPPPPRNSFSLSLFYQSVHHPSFHSEVLKRIFSFFLLSIPESGSFFDVVFWITAAIVILVGSLLLSGNQKIAKFKEVADPLVPLVVYNIASFLALDYVC